MRTIVKLGVIVAASVIASGCEEADRKPGKQSVTVELAPVRPYEPKPGFSLPTDLPDPPRQPESNNATTTTEIGTER